MRPVPVELFTTQASHLLLGLYTRLPSKKEPTVRLTQKYEPHSQCSLWDWTLWILWDINDPCRTGISLALCGAIAWIIQSGFQALSALFQYVSKPAISNKDEGKWRDETLSTPNFLWCYLLYSIYDRDNESLEGVWVRGVGGFWIASDINLFLCLSTDHLSSAILKASLTDEPFIIQPITISLFFCVW